ncbi:MAG: helix-turn-helix domain-containing protein [Flavobacteriaceae bacterium]
MLYTNVNDAFLEVSLINIDHKEQIEKSNPSELMILWFQEDENFLMIDNIEHQFNKNDLLFLTEFHQVEVLELKQTKFIKWNQFFYCIVNHDSEVGCKGILFYGATCLPAISPNVDQLQSLQLMWSLLQMEMTSKDSLQEEVLQISLKKILVLCTRIYRNQHQQLDDTVDVDLIREYHFLVENNFRKKHTVADYASMLCKSPKTLSNIFKKLGSKSPIQYIKNRRTLEAKRLLSYSKLSISQIGFELGFTDVQSFSRYFKRETGFSPVRFKQEKEKLTTNRESSIKAILS